MTTTWVDSALLASAAGISDRKARHALSRALSVPEATWRGATLIVCQRHGRGGRAGLRYEVRVDSLPVDLQNRFKALSEGSASGLSLRHGAKEQAERERRFNIIHPAIDLKKGSRERGAAIRAIAGRQHLTLKGRSETISVRKIERWLSLYETFGLAGLTPRKRADAGKSRYILSAAWDKAVKAHLSPARMREIAAEVRQDLRNLWGNGTSFGDVGRLASQNLADLTSAAGCPLYGERLKEVCRLPQNIVMSESDAKRAAEFRTDRKAWDDKRPRIRQTPEGMAPMEIVFGDVHHTNIYFRRADGSRTTPKLIAYKCAATHRVYGEVLICEVGKGITNADQIRVFINMSQDPYWGLPQTLHLDNGSEYGFADLLKDVLKLNGEGRVIRAMPYSPASKGLLEGTFRNFNQTLLATVPGFIGDDRMNSKVANLGKQPEPYSGTEEEFRALMAGFLQVYNSRPQTGSLKGRCPNDVFRAAVAAGWQRTDIDEHALWFAFSVEETRKVTKGKFSIGREKYYGDNLQKYEGKKLIVRLPKYVEWSAVPVYELDGKTFVDIARPDDATRYGDPRGAEKAAERKRNSLGVAREIAGTVEEIDVPARLIASAMREPPLPVPQSAGVVGLDSQTAAIGRAVVEAPENARDRQDREHSEKQRKQLERVAQLAQRGFTGGAPK